MSGPIVQQNLIPADHDHRQIRLIYHCEEPLSYVLATKPAINYLCGDSINYRCRRASPHQPNEGGAEGVRVAADKTDIMMQFPLYTLSRFISLSVILLNFSLI